MTDRPSAPGGPDGSRLPARLDDDVAEADASSGIARSIPRDELSAKIVGPLVGWIRAHKGEAAVAELASSAGIDPRDLQKPATWLSVAQVERVLERGRGMVESEEQFLEACAYGLRDTFGPLLYVLRGVSPLRMFQIVARTTHLVSRVSRYELLEGTRTFVKLRYTSDCHETRLMCLSRQAFMRAVPPLWGLPKAQIVEEGCISRGDSACVYNLRFYEAPLALPALFGLGAGSAVTALSWWLLGPSAAPLLATPVIGALIGLLLETRRVARQNLAHGEESHRALEALGEEYARALKDVMDLHHRQQEWIHALEQRIADRQHLLDRMREASQMRESRQTTLRALSHDLRNPLQVLRFNSEALREMITDRPEIAEVLDDVAHAVHKAERLIKDLMAIATAEANPFALSPERVPIAPLTDRIRGMLQALVIRRDVRVSVFSTREAPDAIETDPMIFNRVIDNVVSNAAKYTRRGSIVVEITGTPETLCIKVSDTGRGISRERLDQVFRGETADASPLVGDSYGLGLSIVVRLLAQLGGRLEVMSRPDQGTTFWIYFPLKLPDKTPATEQRAAQESLEHLLGRVVTIRQVVNDNG